MNILTACDEKVTGVDSVVKQFSRVRVPTPHVAGSLSGKCWADNENRVGLNISRGEEYSEKPLDDTPRSIEADEELLGLLYLFDAYEAHGQVAEAMEVASLIEGWEPPSSQNSSKSNRAPRGTGGLTAYGRRMIASGCHLIQERGKKSTKAFVTVTMPPLTTRQHNTFCRELSEITRQLLQAIRRELVKAGIPPHICYVIENQGKRAEAEGRFCPHWHFVFQNRHDFRPWVITLSKMEGIVERVFKAVLGESVDCSRGIEMARIKSSVKAYLSNYMKKGSQRPPDNPDHCPSSWWGMSTELKREINGRTVVISQAGCETLMHDAANLKELGILSYYHYVEVEINGQKRVVGCASKFKNERAKEIFFEMYPPPQALDLESFS